MSMLGSPVGGVPYRFVDPSSVWKPAKEPPTSKDAMESPDRADDDEALQDDVVEVRVLLPDEDAHTAKPTRRFPMSSLHGTPYSVSAQISSLPSLRRTQAAGVLPGFRIRRTTRLMGPWEVYAIDGWVLDRERTRKCVVSSREQVERDQQDPNLGILVDEYVPIDAMQRRDDDTGMETDDDTSHVGGITWRDHLEALKTRVEADGGRLVEVDWDSAVARGNVSGKTPSRTRTYLPVTPLPYLAHGLHPIHIPSGNYKQVKERLWMNLDLRRLGCSGRSSVGLAAPR